MIPSSRKKLATLTGTAIVGMTLSLSSFAQTADPAASATQIDRPASMTPGQAPNEARFDSWNMRASQIIGKDVRNTNGEELGEINDVIVNIANQDIHYVILEFGGFLGLGEKLFAYPMEAFALSRDRGELVLNVPKEKLENAPGFGRDDWPNWADARYNREVSEYFGTSRANDQAITQQGVHMRRLSQLIDSDVNDRRGREIGEIEDFVVDIGKGKIAYAVMDFEASASLGDKLLPLPMTALTFPAGASDDLIVDTDRIPLDLARGFEQNLWPDLNASSFRQSMNDYFLALERPVPGQAGYVEGGEVSTGR